MRLFLHTHMLIWWTEADPRLSAAARLALTDPANELFVSSVSAMEIATKMAIGKLSLRHGPAVVVSQAMTMLSARELPLSIGHAVEVVNLPLHHRDPFDRMLVAQAVVEGMTLLTQDALVRVYGVPTVG